MTIPPETSGEHLKSFIERIERLEEDKANVAADIKEVYAEAKGTGFDAKIMRQIVRIRKLAEHERREQEELLALDAESADILQNIRGMLLAGG